MRSWRGHWQDVLFDVLPAGVLLVIGQVDAISGALSTPFGTAPSITAAIPAAIACVALVLRRHHPMVTLTIVVLALVIPPLIRPSSLTYWGEYVAWLVALYSSARHQRRMLALVGIGVSAAAFAVLAAQFEDMRDPADLLYNSVLLVAVWVLGLFARSWAEYRDRIIRSSAERAAAEERASQNERARIARELHDVIAHTITVIVMQAGGARLASVSDPAIARSTLAKIEELGRASLTELRTLLPLLRDNPGEAPVAPQPTLADVYGLCQRMRDLGLPVALEVSGEASDVPLGLQLTGYRAVQEGLTNVLKHSGTVATAVRIQHNESPGSIVIEVASSMQHNSPRLDGAGRGLAGLEERVRLVGGQFTAGPQCGAGFLLRVELPLTSPLAREIG